MNTRQYAKATKTEIDMVTTILARRACDGPRAKPTVAELNDIMKRLGNAAQFLNILLADLDDKGL